MDFQLARADDERIVVDELAKQVKKDAKQSSVATNLISNLNAIKILRRKILFLVDVFSKSKEVQARPDFVRRLNQICGEITCLDKALQQ